MYVNGVLTEADDVCIFSAISVVLLSRAILGLGLVRLYKKRKGDD